MSESAGAFRLEARDEYPHRPDQSSNFNESVYTNAFDSASGVGGWMRLGNRVNEGYAELSVCLYLPDGQIACQFQRPSIAANDRFDAGGLRVDVVEPLRRIDMAYAGELLLLDDAEMLREPERMFKEARRVPGAVRWEHSAASPPHGGEPRSADVPTMYGRDFSLGHFNQHTRVRGHIEVGDRRWTIDGRGWRDHSWGPRYWQSIFWYRLFMANFADGRGLMLLKIADRDGHARRMGVLLVDGAYEDVVDMDVITEWSDKQDPRRIHLSVRTPQRSAMIVADIATLAPLRNRRKADGQVLVSRVAEGYTRFTWDDVPGFGMTEYIERIENGKPIGYPL
jgi:hypothetical protein